MPQRRIHITGAAGSGTTTLGRALAARLGARHLDTDDYFWTLTQPPYQIRREPAERLRLLSHDLDQDNHWILTGGVDGWGASLPPRFELVIFLYLPPATRMARLADRERRRFGPAIDPGGPMHADHIAFMKWAAAYETGAAERSLARHRVWLAALSCPVLQLDSEKPLERIIEQAAAVIADPGAAQNFSHSPGITVSLPESPP